MRRNGRHRKRSTDDDGSDAHLGSWPQDANTSDREGTDREDNGRTVPVEDTGKRYRSFRVRTASTIAMIAGFALFIYGGHVPLMLLVLTLQFLMVRELFTLARVTQKDHSLPGFRLQQWYFFLVAAFYMYLRFITNNLLVELTASRAAAAFSGALRLHTILAYLAYMAGFVSFVLSLKRGMYLYQFGQYAWTHMILLVVFVPSSFFVSNIFEGLIWFLLPCCLIIVNDIMAYIAGFFFGRTPLIKLSPKKTWEGFIGGFVGTVAAAFLLAKWFSQFKWMTCPRQDLSLGPLDCEPDPIYIPQVYSAASLAEGWPPQLVEAGASAARSLGPDAAAWLSAVRVRMEPMQAHAMVLAVFASIVAPFGGFFASGFKRAFKMKDFGDTIPGHGGVTDRFDCQMIMAMFAYLYYWNFVATPELKVGEVLQTVLRLNDAQQLELFGKLANLLAGQRLLSEPAMQSVRAALTAANITWQ